MFKSKKIQLNKNNFEKYNAAKAHQKWFVNLEFSINY